MAVQKMDFTSASLDELAYWAQRGHPWAEEELVHRYEKIILKIIKKKGFYLPRSEDEDLVQEGLIGLFQALKRYQPGRDFHRFALHCIYRQLVSALKTANYKKHLSFNTSSSLDAPCFRDQLEHSMVHFLVNNQPVDPVEYIIQQERKLQVQLLLQSLHLTWLEFRVLKGLLKGFSYETIAKTHGISKKSVDNAFQRIKLKAKRGVLQRKHRNKTAHWRSLDELWLS